MPARATGAARKARARKTCARKARARKGHARKRFSHFRRIIMLMTQQESSLRRRGMHLP